MKTVFRLKFIENKEMFNRIDCYEFDDLKQFKLVIDGKATKDEYPEVFAVGNHIKLNDKSDIFEITKVLTQNGHKETYVDVNCSKI